MKESLFIGDKTQFEDKGLDEADEATYVCSCGYEREVTVQYDLFQRMFFPVRFADTICPKCDSEMDRKIEVVLMERRAERRCA